MSRSAEHDDGQAIAVTAEALFLTNLLLLPGLAFIALAVLWFTYRGDARALVSAHVSQTFAASVWAGFLIIIANGLILLLGGYQGVAVWVMVIIYFTLVHSMLVVFGAFGLSKAMAGQCWRYPFVGRPLPPGCERAGRK